MDSRLTLDDAERVHTLSVMNEFCRALADPGAGERLHQLHAADALLQGDTHLQPAAEIEPRRFASAHHAISTSTQAHPQFDEVVLLRIDCQAAPERVAWFEVTEKRTLLKLRIGVGLRALADELRIGWCTLTANPPDWSYQEGFRQSLADYPWMRRGGPAPARVLLDASYFRRHWRADIRFSTLPDARFSCHMSGACCKHDYEITVPPEAQLLVSSLPWEAVRPELAGTRLRPREDGALQLKELHESCRFLGSRNQCLVHQLLGQQPFAACAVFPFSFADTPEGIAVSLSPICGSMRLGLGVPPQQRADDLRERLVHAEPRRTTTYRLAPQVEVPWAVFRDFEQTLRDCVAAHEVPLRRRLHVGARLLGACRAGEPIEAQRWITEPLTPVTAELRAAIRGMLAKVLGWDRSTLRALGGVIPEALHEIEIDEAQMLVRVLHNVQFSKIYSYPHDLTTAHNFLIVLYLLALIMQTQARGPLPDAMWQELGSLGVHGYLKNLLHEGVPEGFRTLFGTAEFGQWMLAA